MFIMLFNILWQPLLVSLYCFAGLNLQDLRNPELLISIYKWQEYIQSLHVFSIDITRTPELHANNLCIINYVLSVKIKKETEEYNN